MARSFEFDDQYREDVESARPRRRYAADPRSSTGRRMPPAGRAGAHAAPHRGQAFEARTEPSFDTMAASSAEVDDLRIEVANLRECLNRTLDIIAQLTDEDARQDDLARLMGDRMGIVERRVHQLEWSDGVADVYRDMATS